MSIQVSETCVVCGHSSLHETWDLPDLPLTGIYADNPEDIPSPYLVDQTLLFCGSCGHGQMRSIVNPEFLYRDTYTHRTSGSSVSTSGNQFLLDVARSFIEKNTVNQLLEVGCNDIYFLESLGFPAISKAGIDPIFEDGISKLGDVTVGGGFAETFDYSTIVEGQIDLVISAHTFEHIPFPRLALENLEPYLSDDATFIIEVPSVHSMLRQSRMDQVFSQHVNHYSVPSLVRLFSQFGFSLQVLQHNYKYWGGTQILEFARNREGKIDVSNQVSSSDFDIAIEIFTSEMSHLKRIIDQSPLELVGIGAAQMLPILDYHLDGRISQFEAILDDNPLRIGKYFPGIATEIVNAEDFRNRPNTQFIVTAVDSSRALVPRSIELGATSVIVPCSIIN